MACGFFGHRDAPDEIRGEVLLAIDKLIEEGERRFYVGNNGAFDRIVQEVLKEVSERRGDVEYAIVLTSFDELEQAAVLGPTMIPEVLSRAPRRFAVDRLGEWVLCRCDKLIVYYRHRFSHCEKWVAKARRRRIRMIEV